MRFELYRLRNAKVPRDKGFMRKQIYPNITLNKVQTHHHHHHALLEIFMQILSLFFVY